MRGSDLIRCSWQQLRRSGLSAVLCILAVAIGVASVVLIRSIGTSACAAVQSELGALGGDLIFVYAQEGSSGLDPGLSAKLETRIPEVRQAVPLDLELGSYSLRTVSGKAALIAGGADIGEVLPLELLHGRLPTAADVREGSRVAVIDDQLAQASYGRTNVVGKDIQLKVGGRGDTFTIIGVTRSLTGDLNSVLGFEIPALIVTPYSAFGHGSRDTVRYLMVAGDGSEAVADRILNEVEKYTAGETVGIENIGAYIAQVQNILGVVSVFTGVIGMIALLIAGCSVMSSMLSSVSRRRREIGIYLALGASAGTITALYLTESVILCLLGNAAGMAVYAILCAAARIAGTALPVDLGVIAAMSAVSMVIGLLCGIVPARRAASMEPVQILQE